jgi:hypothetical protein
MTRTPVLSPTTPTKSGRVATVGYHQPQAWQIVTRMVAEQGWYLVDIRAVRRSYLEEWSGASLLRHFRKRYHTVPCPQATRPKRGSTAARSCWARGRSLSPSR